MLPSTLTAASTSSVPAPVARNSAWARPSALVSVAPAVNEPAPVDAPATAKLTATSGRRLGLRAES